MQLKLATTGFKEATKRFKTGARVAISGAVFRVANVMEITAKKNIRNSVYASPKPSAPFSRSGKAQQSITVAKLDDLQSKVYMGVNYGQYLEYGTGIYRGRKPYWTTFGAQIPRAILYKGMKARPFWMPAIEETKKQIPSILKNEIDKL
jgi:HK97 gp10 family phage protein